MDASRDERILTDPVLDERLARDGVVPVPMVDPARLQAIEASYWALVPPGEDGIQLDYLRTDRTLVRALSELMEPVWDDVVPRVFESHYPVYSSFVVKFPGEGSSLFLHRDLCVDDERERRTFSMWMPFVDTGPELGNGPLAFVPGSQAIRHGGFGPNAVGLFSPYEHVLRDRLEPFSVPAGTGLVYDARMLHASPPNRSGHVRMAVGCLLARRDQPVIQVFATGRRHRRVHEVDREFFVDHAPEDIARHGMPERYPVIDEYDEDPAVTATDVLGPSLAEAGAQREVAVPSDLEPLAGARLPLATTPGPSPRHRQDLPIAAADLPRPGPTAGDTTVDAGGDVGHLDVLRHWRTIAALPEAVTDPLVPLRPPRSRDVALLVLDPGGRVALRARPRALLGHEVVVLECPAVRAGACSDEHVAELDLGVRIGVGSDHPLHLWNEGPGPLVVVVRSMPVLAAARSLSALAGAPARGPDRASGGTTERTGTGTARTG